jgi:hypothetical protein
MKAAPAHNSMMAAHAHMAHAEHARKSAIPTLGKSGKAKCKDGTILSIKSHSGACSHHGGVAAWL